MRLEFVCSNLLRHKSRFSAQVFSLWLLLNSFFSVVLLQTIPRSFLELTTSQCIASVTAMWIIKSSFILNATRLLWIFPAWPNIALSTSRTLPALPRPVHSFAPSCCCLLFKHFCVLSTCCLTDDCPSTFSMSLYPPRDMLTLTDSVFIFTMSQVSFF